MRQPRIKAAAGAEGVYHCMSRTVNGERLFADLEKEVFRKQMWQIADYCGVQVLTYAVMANHFHLLVHVPPKAPVGDEELLRRYAVLYPKPTRYQTARLSVVQSQLAKDGPDAVAWRARQLALMGDISPFLQLLKQRFTRWFNRSKQRFGTLWSERFKSLLIEPVGRARQAVAAYIDLNAVRAGLVTDPAFYRHCGYAEAVAKPGRARAGLLKVTGCPSWAEAQSAYRQLLFSMGADPRERPQQLTSERLADVIRDHGKIPLPLLLRCRMRYFSDGAILGSREFVASHLAAYRLRTGRLRAKPNPLPEQFEIAELTVLRRLRTPAFEI